LWTAQITWSEAVLLQAAIILAGVIDHFSQIAARLKCELILRAHALIQRLCCECCGANHAGQPTGSRCIVVSPRRVLDCVVSTA